MKLAKWGIGLFALLLTFSACSSKLSEKEYYEAAKKAYMEENFKEAITNFEAIVKYYPEGLRTAEAAFMLGFINANDLKNYDAARTYYQKFIDNYPDHDLADDAQYELKTLGKDINELPIFQELASDSVAN